MNNRSSVLSFLPCIDSPDMASAREQELNIRRAKAIKLGKSAVGAAQRGYYINSADAKVDWSHQVANALSQKISISPDTPLKTSEQRHADTQVQVSNETTLQVSRRLTKMGHRTLALNFANGIHPGGGFLGGARAQEEVLCRSSALYSTLIGDPMYQHNHRRSYPDSSDWIIYSPDVPVFRTDEGTEIDKPWLLSFITSPAPYAPVVGQPKSGDLLEKRIHRVLEVASAYGYSTLVLGAWGCGAFGNNTYRTAKDFRKALELDFQGHFTHISFAITDWSTNRKFLGPFRDVFTPDI